jgi:hypothetical protein
LQAFSSSLSEEFLFPIRSETQCADLLPKRSHATNARFYEICPEEIFALRLAEKRLSSRKIHIAADIMKKEAVTFFQI